MKEKSFFKWLFTNPYYYLFIAILIFFDMADYLFEETHPEGIFYRIYTFPVILLRLNPHEIIQSLMWVFVSLLVYAIPFFIYWIIKKNKRKRK